MGNPMGAKFIRKALMVLVGALALLSLVAPQARAQSCFGDCNASGTLTASDIGRINATILRCGPCPGNIPGGIAGGCAALSGGCGAADFNSDGCLRASELARANQNILRFSPAGGCPTALFTIGSASGAKGAQVAVGITLTKNDKVPVTIAPLRIGFDANVLTFNGCTSTVPGKTVFFGQPATGQASIVTYDDVFGEAGTPAADLAVFPDGQILTCSFTIAAGAPLGSTTLSFLSAGLADAQFNDFPGAGINGSITVQ